MPNHLTPGVQFEWTDESRKAVTSLRTDIAAFVGLAERGPLHTPTRVQSWQQFQTAFGSFITAAHLAYAVKGFFENGGRECFIVRVAAPLVQTWTAGVQAGPQASAVQSTSGFAAGAVVTASQTRATATTGAQPADRASSVVADVSGFPQGALAEIAQPALGLRTARRVRAADKAGSRLLWDRPLEPEFDLTLPVQVSVQHQTDHLLAQVSGDTLLWDTPLPGFYDLAQAIQFASGASAAEGLLAGEDHAPALRVSAASPGIWGNHLSVRVTRTSGASTRTRPAAQSAQASAVDSIVGFLDGALVRVTQDDTSAPPTPITSYRAVAAQGADAARGRITWDAPLDPAYDLAAAQNGTRPISFETLEFGMSVYMDGQLRETFSALTLVPDPERDYPGRFYTPGDEQRMARKVHAEKIVNGASHLIRIEDLRWPHAAGGSFAQLPDAQAASLRSGRLRLRGGRDGFAALRTVDFTGTQDDAPKTGLRALEDVREVAIVAVPDAMLRPAPQVQLLPPRVPEIDVCLPVCEPLPEAEPPEPQWLERVPGFTPDEIERVQQALVAHCAAQRYRIALLDPPVLARGVADAGEIQGWRRRFESKYAALYYPWLFVFDALKPHGQVVRAVPPCGAVAGIYARSDLALGVHKAPANEEVRWAQSTTDDVSAGVQGVLNPAGINCIRSLPGRGLLVYGARTVSSDPDWRFVNVRRLMMMIEAAVEVALQWSVFEPNDFALRQTLVVAIAGFLEALWARGALAGRVAEEAFFVKCDDTNNPPDLAGLGQLVVDVGVAPSRPAEFVIVRIGKTADTLELTEIQTYGALA